MRVVSANLEQGTAWSPQALPRAAALLVDTRADVIAVQECPGGQALMALAQELGYSQEIGTSPTGVHTGLLWAPEAQELARGDEFAEKAGGTWHGFTRATLRAPGWPCPLTFISAHLVPHDVGTAVGEARFLQTRLKDSGYPGVLVGDLNHGPWEGPEPDWEQIPAHNRACRSILDQNRPEEVLLDRGVGLVLHRGEYVDAAAHVARRDGDERAWDYTGVHGKIRVDQCWVNAPLAPAITAYRRLDHRGITDHHPIQIDFDLVRMNSQPPVSESKR